MKIRSSVLSFENTKYASAYKTDKQLKESAFIFSIMRYRPVVSLISRILPKIIKVPIPLVKKVVRNTIFKQFVGGETLEGATEIINKLEDYNVKVILDYGAEGKDNEQSFEYVCNEFIRAIRYAGGKPNIPFVAIKITSIARFAFLKSINDLFKEDKKDFFNFSDKTGDNAYLEELQQVLSRLHRICKAARDNHTAILIDAEESWIQDVIDAITTHLMENYNRTQWVVYNTIQLYRLNRIAYLDQELIRAKEKNYLLGAKLVRGAYMEKENRRAMKYGYPTPIQPDKESCDKDFNKAVALCIRNLDHISVIIATHNEHSNLLGTRLLRALQLPPDHPGVHFSQLYGMSDHITFNLAKEGYNVSKYFPYGKIEEVIPYLVRRARENSSIAGQTGRELALIRRELERRKQDKGRDPV